MWREHRLIAELDGYATHGTRTAFERDRTRDAELPTLRWRVLRVTWRQLEEETSLLVARLRALLVRAA